MFMTFGDRSAFELQQALEDKALARFEASHLKIEAGLEEGLSNLDVCWSIMR